MGIYDKPFENVVGRTLKEIAVSDDGETTLRLSFDDGVKYVTTYADCCSESWWADVIGAASCYNGTITEVKELELPTPDDDRTRQEYDEVYGFALVTTKGEITLAFRNSSNGYYGGSAYDTDSVGSVEWTAITNNDWRA